MGDCLVLTYNAIRYAEENEIRNRRGMKGFYRSLRGLETHSCFKTAVITRACAVVHSRIVTKYPRSLRPMVCLISGFFITAKGRLFIPLQRRNDFFDVQLNRYVFSKLQGNGRKVRSLTITQSSLSFCYAEEVEERRSKTVLGVDRNEKNITFGDRGGVIQIDMVKAVKVRQTTREILGSFKRNDVRVRRRLARKYCRRCNYRTNQILHAATNFMVEAATRNNATFALEDLTAIRRMYQKGNGQSRNYRFRLNSWPHWKAKHMLEYKSAWEGIEVIQLTRSETNGSSSECSACGEKLRSAERDDAEHKRMLWCQECEGWIDRDVNAALNLSTRGLARFASSRPQRRPVARNRLLASDGEKGLAGEAMKGNPEGRRQQVILRVDASKLHRRV